jgi:hypothetical protein
MARTDAIAAAQHRDHPKHLESVPMPDRVVTSYSVSNLLPETPGSANGSSAHAQGGNARASPVVSMPEDNTAFWASLERRGEGKNTTIFVLVDAVRPYVDGATLDAFVQENSVSKNKIKAHPITGRTLVNMGTIRKKFPDIPWPRKCSACGMDKTLSEFTGTRATCKACGGSTVESRAAAAGLSVDEFRERDMLRKKQKRNGSS